MFVLATERLCVRFSVFQVRVCYFYLFFLFLVVNTSAKSTARAPLPSLEFPCLFSLEFHNRKASSTAVVMTVIC